MGIYAEKRDKLAARIAELTKRISDDTAKKQEFEEKLKEANRLAMAEEYNCKPRELDEIISSEHTLLQKLRASGLTDAELLEMVGVPADDNGKDGDSKSTDNSNSDKSDSDTAEDDDEIKFYGDALTD